MTVACSRYLFPVTVMLVSGGAGCSESLRAKETAPVGDEAQTEGSSTPFDGSQRQHGMDAGSMEPGSDSGSSALEEEEARLEDSHALEALIQSRLSGEATSEPSVGASVEGDALVPVDAEGPGTLETDGDGDETVIVRAAPTAGENMKLSSGACLRRLKSEGISFERPGFPTPNVGTPVLLNGPVGGVQIRPRWPASNRKKEVMDCHLALALVEVAHQAKTLGVVEINFYSTYRPLRPPPKKCPKGKRRKRCLRAKRKYRKALRSKSPSQHRFARAIDIRFLRREDGSTVDVLEHFDRRSGKDPCSYQPDTEEAKLLSDFVCGLWRTQTFNIMLTPNANRAHHNHFHFDLSAKAKWYIIR